MATVWFWQCHLCSNLKGHESLFDHSGLNCRIGNHILALGYPTVELGKTCFFLCHI